MNVREDQYYVVDSTRRISICDSMTTSDRWNHGFGWKTLVEFASAIQRTDESLNRIPRANKGATCIAEENEKQQPGLPV